MLPQPDTITSKPDHTHRTQPNHVQTARPTTLFGRGRLTGRRGMAAAAAQYFAQLASESAARLGPDHPDTSLAREEHACWTGTSGQAEQAAALFGDLLAVPGPASA